MPSLALAAFHPKQSLILKKINLKDQSTYNLQYFPDFVSTFKKNCYRVF